MTRVGHRCASTVSALALVGGMLLVPVPRVAAAACSIENARTSLTHDMLQEAVDAADDGDTLLVSGTCVGNTSIQGTLDDEPKSLRLVGVSSAAQPTPTLDGGDNGIVLGILGHTGRHDPRAKVVIRDLAITGGKGTGIRVLAARLTLRGDTTVTGNRAVPWVDMSWEPGSGGGIAVTLGTLRLNDSASVTDNTVEDENDEGDVIGGSGGGIHVVNGRLVLNDSATVDGNDAPDGGGIYAVWSHISLNGSSSVSANAAHHGGGIFVHDADVTMNGVSSVTGNTSRAAGGGVFVYTYRGTRHGRVYVCSDEVAISPNDPDDPPKVRHVCP